MFTLSRSVELFARGRGEKKGEEPTSLNNPFPLVHVMQVTTVNLPFPPRNYGNVPTTGGTEKFGCVSDTWCALSAATNMNNVSPHASTDLKHNRIPAIIIDDAYGLHVNTRPASSDTTLASFISTQPASYGKGDSHGVNFFSALPQSGN